jgi:hypothetical protein
LVKAHRAVPPPAGNAPILVSGNKPAEIRLVIPAAANSAVRPSESIHLRPASRSSAADRGAIHLSNSVPVNGGLENAPSAF